MIQKIAVIGLGLIGGSFCKAVQAYTHCPVAGFDRDPEVLRSALEYGAVDVPLADETLSQCDLILFALYPQDTIRFVREHLHLFREGCLLLDTCGVKELVCGGIREVIASRKDLVFVGGHPMAGKEFSGFAVSDKDLFRDANMVLTPPDDVPKDAMAELSAWLRSLGFARIIETTPEFHDRMIAYTSQLPHVVASSYVKSPNCRYQLGFTGGSFEDMSRVAKLNETMWTELFLANRENLMQEIDTLCDRLQELRESLAQRDAPRLRRQLAEGRIIKEGLMVKE